MTRVMEGKQDHGCQDQTSEEKNQDEGITGTEDYIEIYEEHDRQFEINSKYIEIKIAKNRIKELKQQKKHSSMDEF